MNSNSSTTDPKIDLYLVCENLCFQEDYHAYVKITQVSIAATSNAMYIYTIYVGINIDTCFIKNIRAIHKWCHLLRGEEGSAEGDISP